MELRILRYFLTVANERNITRAAQSLHVSQPTLSKQLMDLEDELDLTLSMRGNREITLTEDGEYFLQKTREILALVDQTIANIHRREQLSGQLHIGGNESPQLKYLAQLFADIRQENPKIQLRLHGMTTDLAFEQLDKGLLDFVLSVGLVDAAKYEHIKLPWQDKAALILPTDHPLAQKNSITGQDLEGYPIIAFSQEYAYTDLANWMGTSPDKLSIAGTFNVPSIGIHMAQGGLGLAFSLEEMPLPKDLTSRPLEPAATPSLPSLRLIWKKDQVLSNLAQEFLQKIKELS